MIENISINQKMKIKHTEWGIGDILYELSGGYSLLVNFNNFGKMEVFQKDCEEVQGNELAKKQDIELEKVKEEVQGNELAKKQDIELEKVNKNITKFMDIIKKNQKGILKSEIISELQISENIFNQTLQKVLRLPEYHFIFNSEDDNDFIIKFVPEIDTSGNSENKKIVEAFRLGIVPGFAVQDITVGREKEIKEVEKWLAKDSESLMIIGQYGQGKSHIIRYIREKALEQGYLVGYCDIGAEANMHKPRSVFNTLMKSLEFRYKDGKKNNDISSFLKSYAVFASKKGIGENISKFLWPGIDNLTMNLRLGYTINELDGKYLEGFADYLCGDEDIGNPYRFKKSAIVDYQTAASIICNILSSIGNMAASMNDSKNNFKGLILIFDEGETIDSPANVSRERDSGINFIKGLVEVSNNNEDLLSENHDEQNWDNKYTGELTNLMYSGMHQDVRFSDQKENHLKCLFAFVQGESEVISTLEKYGVGKIVLNEFDSDEQSKLIYKIIEIYEKAYEYEVKDIEKLKNILFRKLDNKNNINNRNTRSIIKITVEAVELIKEFENSRPEADVELDYEKILR